MKSLKLHPGATHAVVREDIFHSVLKLYEKQEVTAEHPFCVCFSGERAIDFGGVARDMFSAFFEEAYKVHFDGASLLAPVVHPTVNMQHLPLLGAVISHVYLSCGILPTRIAFPCLVSIQLKQLMSTF